MTTLLIVIIILALGFDYINGFHDAANSIATVVSTRVLSPTQAVIWAAAFNFAAFFIFKDHGVANTIAKTVQEQFVTLGVITSGLIAAIIWNLLTWWRGIPSSSSHTLIGGFMGAAIAHAGFQSLNPEPIIKTASFILLAPFLGMIVAMLMSLWFLHSFKKAWYPKIISLVVILGVSWLVYSKMEFKKDFAGGSVYTLKFDAPIEKDKVKKAFTFVDEKEKEYAPVVKLGKDESGKADETKTLYTIKTGFLKKKGETTIDPALTKKVEEGISKTKLTAVVTESHRVLEDSPERFDISHLKANYDAYWLKVIFHGSNFKWLLLAFIAWIVGIFTLSLSSLNHASAERWFKRMQLVSSGAFSIGHGGNDAQKVMGIISAALIAGKVIPDFEHMPDWVPLACYAAIAAGTMSGGWKIIKTMGSKITKVTPFEGVAAETAGAAILFMSENLKIPVSTTHTITGAIIGVGATKRLSAVRWGVTTRLLVAWIITIPVSAGMGAVCYWIFNIFGGI
ncbi:MAG: inorganic phosphate transporter [Bacteroidetes bacterium]|nr:inorganic phosphate transporter [Bacteroidota bacterium]